MLYNMAHKVVIIEPINIIRDTLKMILHEESNATLQGTLSNISSLFPLLEMREVNIVFSEVFDEKISLVDGINSLRMLKSNYPNIDLIVHTEIEEPALLIQTNADAIYSKRNSVELTRLNFRKILTEKKVISAHFYEDRKMLSDYSYLSEYEWKILVLFCRAQNIRDIATLLKCSYRSVSRVKRKIMRALKITNNTQFKIMINHLNKKMGQ